MGGEKPPISQKGREASPPEKVSKQRRGTIRWMVPLNVFAGPRAGVVTAPESLLRKDFDAGMTVQTIP